MYLRYKRSASKSILDRHSIDTYINFIFCFLVEASGEFVVLHSPDSIEFTVNGEIEQSSLKEILSAALGYTGKQVYYLHSSTMLPPQSFLDMTEFNISNSFGN